jgi:hypothetical protein
MQWDQQESRSIYYVSHRRLEIVMIRGPFLNALLLAGLFHFWGTATSADDHHRADPGTMVSRGEKFLVGLFDPTMDLLPEYAGAKVYWLYHDNYLAAKVLEGVDDELVRRIRERIRSAGVASSGKIEILFGELDHPLPFKQFELLRVTSVGEKEIRTERVTTKDLRGWQEYADLLALRVLGKPDDDEARQSFDRLMAMWDGKGFADRVTEVHRMYATYKLALAILASQKLGKKIRFKDEIVSQLAAVQEESGGFRTDYDLQGKPLGLANVETTSMVVLALRADRD